MRPIMAPTDVTPAPKDDEAVKKARLLRALNVLDRLGAGEPVSSLQTATGLNDDDLRACFRLAATAIRDAGSGVRPELDPQRMTIAEALEVLAAHGMDQRKLE